MNVDCQIGLDWRRYQVLLGVTGSGKTFTMAKVIQNIGRPALVLAHNKTLAAQLYASSKPISANLAGIPTLFAGPAST